MRTILALALLATEVQGAHKPCRQVLLPINNGTGYVFDMKVGPFAQLARLDTGSNDILVMGTDCLACTGATYNSRKSPTFHTSKGDHARTTPVEAFGEWMASWGSKTQKADFGQKDWGQVWTSLGRTAKERNELQVIKYNSGPVVVVPGKDDVQINCNEMSTDGIAIQEVIQHMVPSLTLNKQMTTIMGFGPGAADEAHQRLHHMLGMDRFTICYPKDLKGNGAVIWNDMHPGFRSGVVELSVVGKVSWGVGVDRLRLVSDALNVNDVVGCEDGCAAILDTGTSMLAFDQETTKSVFAAWEKMNDCSRFHELPDVKFMLGGVEHVLPPEAYVSVVIPCFSKEKHLCRWNPVKDDSTVMSKEIGFDAIFQKPLADVTSLYQKFSGADKKKLSLLQTGSSKGLKCELLLEKDFDMGDTDSGPLMVLGTPFFRYYTTTFDVSEEKDTVKRLKEGQSAAEIWPEGVDSAPNVRRVYTRPAGVDCSEEEVESPRRKARGLQLFKTRPRMQVTHEEELVAQRTRGRARMEAIKSSVGRFGL